MQPDSIVLLSWLYSSSIERYVLYQMIIAIFTDNACGLCTEYKWLKTNLLAIELLITIRRFEILTDRTLVFSNTPFLRDCTRSYEYLPYLSITDR